MLQIPLMRVLQTNWLGLLIQTAGTSWVRARRKLSTTCAQLKEAGYHHILNQHDTHAETSA